MRTSARVIEVYGVNLVKRFVICGNAHWAEWPLLTYIRAEKSAASISLFIKLKNYIFVTHFCDTLISEMNSFSINLIDPNFDSRQHIENRTEPNESTYVHK